MPETWCDFGDLPESQCAHCKGDRIPARHSDAAQGAIDVAKDLKRLNTAVAAQFNGRCRGCLDPIRIGEFIRPLAARDGDGATLWVHEECE